MRKFVYAILIFLFFASTGCSEKAGENRYIIKGRVADSGIEKIYLYGRTAGRVVTDTADVVRGRYRFEGDVQRPFLVKLSAGYRPQAGDTPPEDIFTMYIENKMLKVTSPDSLKNSVVAGSAINEDMVRWQKIGGDADRRRQELFAWYAALPEAEKKAESMSDTFMDRLNDIRREERDLAISFIKANPASYYALGNLYYKVVDNRNLYIEDAGEVLAGFSGELRASELWQEYYAEMELACISAVGAVAPDFTENDPHGNPVSLSSLRGRYVLLDFWAAWCGPCRAENPHVVRAFRKYGGKGFTVLGVSLDGRPQDKNPAEAWEKAIKNDGLAWTNVSDLRGWDSRVAAMYNVKSIPANFLIGPDGTVLAKNLKGDALMQKLKEYLGK